MNLCIHLTFRRTHVSIINLKKKIKQENFPSGFRYFNGVLDLILKIDKIQNLNIQTYFFYLLLF